MPARRRVSPLNPAALVAAITLAVPTLGSAGLTNDLTFSEELPFADVAVIARLVDATPPVVNDQGMPIEPGHTTFEIVHVLKVAPGTSEPATTIESRYYFDQPPGSLFMLYAVDPRPDGGWVTREPITEECAAYVLGIVALESKGADRLRYFVPFLQHPDPRIAADAVREFGLASREDLASLVSEIDSDFIAACIRDDDTDPQLLYAYGWLLGMTGATQHVPAIREMLLEPIDEIRLGIDGVMVGYVMLAGHEGWDLIEREKMLNRDAPFSETYAAIQAARHLLTDPVDGVSREHLLASMRSLLNRPELADLIIADLARWEDWSVVDRLYEMYDAEAFQEPAIQRSIIRYFLMAQNAGCNSVVNGAEIPEFADSATRHLDDIRRRDPMRVEQAMRYFMPADAVESDEHASPNNRPISNPLLNRDWWRC